MLGLSLSIWRPAIAGGGAPATGIITANRQVWLRKGTASGATWPDASGNARNMTLIGSPTIGASSVTFNGTTQYGTIATTSMANTKTLYLRVKQIAWSANARIAGALACYLYQATSTPTIALRDSDATAYASNPGAAIGAFANFCFADGLGACVININGSEVADISASDSMISFAIAASPAGANFSNIEVIEVVIYDVKHDAAQRAQMIAYLGTL